MGVTPARQDAMAAASAVLPLTVAVCTHERPRLLERALTSLLRLSPPAAEILVIDNAPQSDATRRMLAASFGSCRYIAEPVAGLDFARNRALREAREDVVAFLDDDAVAEPDWALHLWMTLHQHPDVRLCTGRTDALSQATDAQRLFECNGGYARGDRVVHLPYDARRRLHRLPAPLIAWAVSVGNGTNFAVHRATALAIGGFDEALELGAALHGGGDLDLFWRVLQAGHELMYQPLARAQHEHRSDMDAMARQLADHQRALVAFLVKSRRHARGRTRREVTVFLWWRLVKPVVRMVRRVVGQDPLPLPILWGMWRSALSGLTAYSAGIRVARQQRGERPLDQGRGDQMHNPLREASCRTPRTGGA